MPLWTPAWQRARDAKETERQIALKIGGKLWDEYAGAITPEQELEVLSASAPQIVENIKTKRPGWTASNVMLVYIRQASKAQQKTNALTEILFAHALKHAQDMDKEFARTGEVVGPLHGVPVSLKDLINVKDVDSTIGFTHETNHPAADDAALVKVIRRAGGIPFVKTNVPQTMLSFECGNPLFGATTNPYDPARIPGGSSGGEAALLASDGSPLGIGSDIGGSLRIPAHFSGCYALKPCHSRISSLGCRSSNPGSDVIRASLGGMGRSVGDIELVHRVLFDAAPGLAGTDGVIPVGYREVKLPKKLRFGYFVNDGFCRASPACQRAVLETVEALRKEGHDCIEFEPPNPLEAMEYFVALTSAGRYSTLLSGLQGDPQESSLWLVTLGSRLPSLVRNTLAWLMENVVGDKILARLFRASRGKSVSELQEWQHRRDVFVHKARKDLWEEHAFDAVLCPVQATPALKHGQTWNLSPLSIGTILWNVIDSSVGLLPVTRVSAALDTLTSSSPWWDAQRASPGSKLVESRVYGTPTSSSSSGLAAPVYNAQEMDGLPVGVQVVGKMWDEERVVEVMKVVDAALGERGFGPGEFVRRMLREGKGKKV
ncbi:hypothetical protein JCM6882_007491 [Rhodosporidiobolus microsporus]